MTWRPSLPAILAWLSIGAAMLMQYLRLAPIGNVLATAIYFIVWWVSLFAILPFGVRTQSDAGEVIQGTSAGAPVSFRFGRVAAFNTIVATVAFAALLIALRLKLVPLG